MKVTLSPQIPKTEEPVRAHWEETLFTGRATGQVEAPPFRPQ